MVHWPWLIFKDSRGSIFLGGLILALVMTTLGFALFNLGVIESRLVLGTEAEQQAFKIAEAGLQRALYYLFVDYVGSSPFTNPPPSPSWADGTIAGINFSVTTDVFATFLSVATFAPSNGTYSVQLKHLQRRNGLDGANDIGEVCNADSDTAPCKDLIYVRVTGDFSFGSITSTRTLQELVRVANITPFRGGVVAGGCQHIQGNTRIAGDFHLPDCSSNPCVAFGGTSGVRNDYNDLSDSLQERISPLQRVSYAAQQVESLGASVRLCKAAGSESVRAVDLSGTATLGTSSIQNNPYTGNPGKPTMDEVLLGNGCDNSDCSDEVGGTSGASNIFSDAPLSPCDPYSTTSFPKLDALATINGITYPQYANCPAANTCTCPSGSGCADNSGGSDFYISHAFKIVSTTPTPTLEDRFGCPAGTVLPLSLCGRNLFNILTGTGGGVWDDTTDSFTKTFVCGNHVVGDSPDPNHTAFDHAVCDDTGENRVNGSVNDSKPPAFQIEWNKPMASDVGQPRLTIYQCPKTAETEASTGDDAATCAAPTATCRDGSAGDGLLVTCDDASALAGFVDAGVHRWKVTFVDSNGVESATGASNFLTVLAGGRQVRLTIPIGPAGTTGRNIYRTIANNSREYRRVNTTILDNTTSTFTDNVADATIILNPAGPRGVLSHATATNPVLPMLLYVDGALRICKDCNNKEFEYQGQAAFLAKGDMRIDPSLLTVCTDAALNTITCNTISPPDDPNSLVRKNLLSFLTPGTVEAGLQSNRDMMAIFYAGVAWKTSKQTNVLGAVTALSCDMGTNVPRFFQVPRLGSDLPKTLYPGRGPSYRLARVRWKECHGVPADNTLAACL